MRIVILGARGFLGQRLVHSLARAGHQVTAVSRGPLSTSLPEGARYVEATIDDSAALESVLNEADFAIHLAWDTTPGTSQAQPVMEVSTNLMASARLIEMMQRQPACRLVFVSSGGAIYADSGALLDENSLIAPRSYYGAAKYAVERMLHAYHAQTSHTALVVRPPNIYGPGQVPKRQFGIVPTLMRCARNGTTFEIWGDGSTIRDYLYIKDFERFIEAIVTFNWPHSSFECFNAGCGAPVSINQLCEAVEGASGRRVHREFRAARSVDTHAVMLNSGKAREWLNWEPRTALEAGLRETWSWMKHTQ